MSGRLVSMIHTGRHVAARRDGGVDLIDVLGPDPRIALDGAVDDLAWVGGALWLLRGDRVERWTPAGRRLAPEVALPHRARRLIAARGADANLAVAIGERACRIAVARDEVTVEPIAATGRLLAPHGPRLVVARGDALELEEAGRPPARIGLPSDVAVVDAVGLFGARALAVWLGRADAAVLWVMRGGKRVHEVATAPATAWAVAPTRGLAILACGGGGLSLVDLRYGQVIGTVEAPCPIGDLAIDDDGRHLVIAAGPEGDDAVVYLAVASLLPRAARAPAPPVEVEADPEPAGEGAAVAPLVEAEAAPAPVDLVPLAFRALPAAPRIAPTDAPRFAHPGEHLDGLLDIAAMRVARAIALAWSSGRLSAPADDGHPFEREVEGLLGVHDGLAPAQIAAAGARLVDCVTAIAVRAAASLADGAALPFPALVRDVGLSSLEAQILLAVIAPHARGEIARLYGVLGNDTARALVDRDLVEVILADGDGACRRAIAAALAPGAPLVRWGLVRIGRGAAPFAPLEVDPALLDRMAGRPAAPGDGGFTLRHAEVPLAEVRTAPAVVAAMSTALAAPRPPGAPLRMVLRGRRGSGRRTLLAALAARVGRPIGCIDLARVAAEPPVSALRRGLVRAAVHGAVPVISGLDAVDPDDRRARGELLDVLATHPGPLVVRAAPGQDLPLAPGHLGFELPTASEGERLVCWREVTARAGLAAVAVDELASRFRIGPGVVDRVVREVAATLPADATPAAAHAALAEAARQHLATRLDRLAHPVTRLARWEQVALPDEMLDSLRELIGRARHRRTVFEEWGYDDRIATARGVTALFYGPPGTGKTLVAGLIARELGLDVYRIDLSRVVSKWIGETEKNLGELFDAAEDGQVLLLFDEADALFAKRGEVKSSVDRYANMEVDYLLQRLDSFEGVAVLTTNLEGAIDPAFKRRMTVRIHFPFPDEEMRTRLWAAHVPARVPTRGDLDFAELASRFPLSGGHVRNCALRAAFLAAQERTPLSQAHLLRAVQLEYRELGKLQASGRME